MEGNNKSKPLSEMIEKIIERGNVTREDQQDINRVALKADASTEDFVLLCNFMDMIKDGKIKVLN